MRPLEAALLAGLALVAVVGVTVALRPAPAQPHIGARTLPRVAPLEIACTPEGQTAVSYTNESGERFGPTLTGEACDYQLWLDESQTQPQKRHHQSF